MQTIDVKQGQSFFDAVIVSTGDITNAFEIALKNGVSITDTLETGDALRVVGNSRTSITSLFNKKHYPATAIELEQDQQQDQLLYVFPYILPMI